MRCNVLTDIVLVRTTKGELSVADFLLSAHRKESALDRQIPAYEYGALWRFLCSLVAVAVQLDPELPKRVREKTGEGISPALLEQVIERLGTAIDLYDDEQPFFQRPVLPPKNAKDTSRDVSPGKKPAWKLSPTAPSETSQTYWDLAKFKPESLDTAEAVRALMVFAMYSFTGNAKYDGAKCLNGSPGIRFLGAGNTATELLIDSATPLESMLKSIPKTWVKPGGLPAWADRTGTRSRLSDGMMHELWRATWSSNTSACCWEDGKLLGVGPGGIPEEWFALKEMGTTSDSRKSWWDQRNTTDPFYLYKPDKQGVLKAQRMDLSKDSTELAVEWAHEGITDMVSDSVSGRVLTPDFTEDSIVFLRHQIAGNASSAMIRESVITQTDRTRWCFDPEGDILDAIRGEADFLLQLRNIIRAPFRRSNSHDLERSNVVLDDLESLRPVVNEMFWRRIDPIYQNMVRTLNEQDDPEETIIKLRQEACDTAVLVFRDVLNPYLMQNPRRNFQAQRQVKYRVDYLLKQKGEDNND
ncbi:type I-E CRISPR-associated protein Cse1/CasA [Corynebacterium sp. sy017]|uniref:type I-E CRISPR-associated protein Cse1/CasA n=1 Tax=unclassified Corynebacterium TaxID=2624378 RepID=UPI0011861A02|nr:MULTISPECIES: type I-E CRISPR-associated protein Cse1/CasA [unclassified Corynebacterium]MBP3088478.1 type I-E CRISPR-associated protein Cse1/CasA [Corynebacterium sp. sy017]TSD91786.1 type I-E CRISPR-associated protein Cse1/CasA [Corynebacterium sp. SY003]